MKTLKLPKVKLHDIALIVGILATTSLLALEWTSNDVGNVSGDNNVITIGRSPLDGSCPDGWKFTFIAQPFPSRTCSKDGVVATLAPDVNKAERCLDTENPDASAVSCKEFGWGEGWVID